MIYLNYKGEYIILSKWSVYQLLSLLYIISLFYIVEQFKDTPPSILMIMGFTIAILGWIYVVFYLQLKKKPNLLEHAIWKRMPVIISSVGIVSFIAFIISATTGSLDELVAANRSLLYVFLTYFILLLFLFVISLVHKFSEPKHNVLNHALLWTIGLLLIIFFIL